jgi:hypothetical protein
MEERRTRAEATKLWQEAYGCQLKGDLDHAIELYERSIEIYPTAEGIPLGVDHELPGPTGGGHPGCLRAIAIDRSSATRTTTSGCT